METRDPTFTTEESKEKTNDMMTARALPAKWTKPGILNGSRALKSEGMSYCQRPRTKRHYPTVDESGASEEVGKIYGENG